MPKENAMRKIANTSLSMPVLHPYIVEMRRHIARYNVQVRGKNGISDQTRLAPTRIDEIIAGDMPTLEEHKALCRCLGSLKHQGNVLALWHVEKAERDRREASISASKDASKERRQRALDAPTIAWVETPGRPDMVTQVSGPESVVRRTFGEPLAVERPANDRPSGPGEPPVGSASAMARWVVPESFEPAKASPSKTTNSTSAPPTPLDTVIDGSKSASLPGGASLPIQLSIRPRTFGERVRALREREGLTQEAVADLVGVTGTAVTSWELDQAIPVKAHYEKLCDLFTELRNLPRPKSRDIEAPRGNRGSFLPTEPEKEPEMIPSSATATPLMPSPPSKRDRPDVMTAIRFGAKVEALRAAMTPEQRGAIVELLQLGEKAGLTIEQILQSLLDEGK